MMLGDLGADVIKVERPGAGDETRGWGPPFDARGESAYFLSINRNKLSVAADLDEPAMGGPRPGADRGGRRRGRRISFRGTLDRRRTRRRMRSDAERPELVWCTISGFGPERDRARLRLRRAGGAAGGCRSPVEPDGAPMKHGVALVDVVAGKDAAIAILAALVGRAHAPASARDCTSRSRRAPRRRS